MSRAPVAIVHDHIVQSGGAERVVLLMSRAFPGAAVHTAFFEPSLTFPEFGERPIKPMPINRLRPLRHRHRLALPLLAPAFSSLRVDADVVICSSAGWAHGAHTTGRKIIYWYTPAPWLHAGGRPYLDGQGFAARAALKVLGPPLRSWDRRAALSAVRHIADSTWIATLVRRAYDVDVDVLLPPSSFEPHGEERPLPDVEPGAWLTVGRLVTHKNIDVVVKGFADLPHERLVVIGDGPMRDQLRAAATRNVTIAGPVTDAQLRWAYRHCAGVVTAAHEDYGLTPIEAGGFGRPVLALRWGGFLDTVVEGTNGLFIDAPEPSAVSEGVRRMAAEHWDEGAIKALAERFSEPAFIKELQTVVAAVQRGA